MSGSSGSPVFRSKTVVGLHHLGYDARTVFNRALHIDRVLATSPRPSAPKSRRASRRPRP
jgi:hypothetical protein